MAVRGFFGVGPLDNNVYIILDPETQKAALVDPAMQSQELLGYLEKEGLALDYIIDTHGHFDHIYNNVYFKERTGAKLLVHQEDSPMFQRLGESVLRMGMGLVSSPSPDDFLVDGQTISLGSVEIQVLHTPGHTPGSICLYTGGAVITGDTLFQGSVGRFDGPGSSGKALLESIKTKLLPLSDDTLVLPGHGPASTIGQEKQDNPFLQDGAERWLGLG